MTLVSALLAASLLIATMVGFMLKAFGEPVTVLWIFTMALGMLLGFVYGFTIGSAERNSSE